MSAPTATEPASTPAPDAPPAVSADAAARLATLGTQLLVASVALSIFAVAAWALSALGSTADVVATVLALAFSVVPVVLALRHRAALDWVRFYPRAPAATEVDADESDDPLLDLDQGALARLQQVRRFDLGLLLALAPGFLLLARCGLGPHPLDSALSEVRSLLFYRGLFVLAVVIVVSGWFLRPRPGRVTALGQVIWILLIAAGGLWSANFVFDGAPAKAYPATFAARYHTVVGTDTGADRHLPDPPPPLRLAALPLARHGLTIYDPDVAWMADHARGDPVKLWVKPGALGIPWIQRLTFPASHEHTTRNTP